MGIMLTGQRTPKRYFQGTHRSRAPAETLAAYRPLLPRMGITRIANVTGLDRIGLPVCVAVRPNARSLATSQGKGETIEAAMVSAMMESIELWHAEHVDQPLRHESWSAMRGRAATMDLANAPIRIDASFDPARPIQWIEGTDLMNGQACWLPFELVSMNLVRQPGQQPIFLESSNGLSSGNHPAEALVHGLAEIIERDAMTLWELHDPASRKRRQVDPATVHEPGLRAILDHLAETGIITGIWDVTSDIGLPTFSVVILEDPDSPWWRPIPAYFGAGAHLDPVIALSRAIHEAIQSRLTAISGSRDDMFHADYVRAGNRDDHARIIADLRSPPATHAFPARTLPVGAALEDDLETMLGLLRRVGVDSVLAVDLSRPDIGIPVTKVVAPQLEPYLTPFYRPGARARQLAAANAQAAPLAQSMPAAHAPPSPTAVPQLVESGR